MANYDIRFVSIYLRKSRGDEDKDLQKHRNTLVELCVKNKWKYIEYAEIGSSDSIEMRPQFKQLLSEIESELYDAVVVMDYDRLSRGSKNEQGQIEDILKKSNTLIITPRKIYDLNNESDEDISDFESFFARHEYKTIIRRFRQGKKAGAKMGNWTNGIPPFPYEYQRWGNKYNEKGLVVNDDKLITYRYIIDQAMKGVNPQAISVDLNKKNILSPRGRAWSNVSIYRLLVDETHLGKIISNKTQGDGHKIKKTNAKEYKKLPRSEWNIVDNCHEAVKTQLEHDTIIELIQSRKKTPKRARAGTYELSGLVKCGVCGHGMTFQKKDNGYLLIKPCWYKNPKGEKCPNRGGAYIEALESIKEKVNIYIVDAINSLKDSNNGDYGNEIEAIQNNLVRMKKDIDKYSNALDKVNDAYELGDYSREEWLKRKEKWENLIYSTKNDIDSQERKIVNLQNLNPEDRINYYNSMIDRLDTVDVVEINNIYKELIKSITWTRLDDDVDIEIEYN